MMLEITFRLAHPAVDVDRYDYIVSGQLGASYAQFDGVAFVTAYTEFEGDGVLRSALQLAREIEKVGGIAVMECDADLVDLVEIARRCEVTHEAVRQWTSGNRRPDTPFPLPSHIIAGRRLWDWCDVNRWLSEVSPSKADSTRLLTRVERVEVNYRLLADASSSAKLTA